MVGGLSSASWLGFGEELGTAGITFAFKLSLTLQEAVGLSGPPRCQRGPPTCLHAGRWVHPTSPSIPTPLWPRGRRIGHFHALAIFVSLGAPLLWLPIPPVPRGPSVWLGWGLGEQEGGGGSPHGSFKKPTTSSRNQLKVTAGTCGLGSGERGRRDGGREDSSPRSK